VGVRSAGDNDSTAVKVSDDQLAARRASRAKHPRSARARASVVVDPAPIDPSLGTGLIDNVIVEPEADDTAAPPASADEVLDRYSAELAEVTAPGGVIEAPRSADDELDEIELQLRRRSANAIVAPRLSGPRGSADLTPDTRQIRKPRRQARRHLLVPDERWRVRLRWAAVVAVALTLGGAAIFGQSGQTSHGKPSTPPRQQTSQAGFMTAALSGQQLTTAARLRTLVAIHAEKTAAAEAAQRHQRARILRGQRHPAHTARPREVPHAHPSAATSSPVTRSSSTASPVSQPTAEGASVSQTVPTTPDQSVKPAAPTGPTGGLGSLSGGCNPQCS
jgi:hypothetical protein